jgi:hypothetical protein
MGAALKAAKRELLRDLEHLSNDTQFQVILYDLQPSVIELGQSSSYLTATEATRSQLLGVLANVPSQGGTDHPRALKKALSLMPQVIYFVTDADELKTEQVQELTHLNQRGCRAVIHCIELRTNSAASPLNQLERLAQQNGGQYRLLDPANGP